MAARFLVALTLLAAPVLAGCIGAKTDIPGNDDPIIPTGLFASNESLWLDPQDAPHPAFNFPTLANPPLNGSDYPDFWKPVPMAPIPATIKGLKPVARAADAGSKQAGGIAVFGSLVVKPGFGRDAQTAVIDISDPMAPQVLSTMDVQTRGAGIIAYPNGRLLTVLSTSQNILVYDITDPTSPKQLPSLESPTGSHKLGVVPGTPIVYNANSNGGGGATGNFLDPTANVGSGNGQTEIYDLSNPDADAFEPIIFKNGYGCHHIYFWITAEKQRALCAGLQYTQIWDIANPLEPKVIVSIPVHHGVNPVPAVSAVPVMFSHSAMYNDDGTVLVVGDEMMGGGTAECVGVGTPATQVSGPMGALWFYDVKDEKNPKLLGWFSPGITPAQATGSCTAHHGRLVPGPDGRQLLAMAFYGAGVVLVDFTDPTKPVKAGQFAQGTDTWEVWYYNGYLFTGDLARGLDVLTFR